VLVGLPGVTGYSLVLEAGVYGIRIHVSAQADDFGVEAPFDAGLGLTWSDPAVVRPRWSPGVGSRPATCADRKPAVFPVPTRRQIT